MRLKKIDRQELASAIKADSSHIGKIARGNNWPGTDMTAAMCRVLDCSMDWLILGRGAPPTATKSEPTQRRPTEQRRRFELVSNAPPQKSEQVTRRPPDVVIAFLATEGEQLAPEVVSRLQSFDYDGTQMRGLTLEQVRRLARLLATEPQSRDD